MTPEERAEQLVQLIARGDAAFDKRGWIEMPKADRNRYITRSSEHLEAIAQAIRDAEDAALERAARDLRLTYIANVEGDQKFVDGLHCAIERVDSLKSKQEI